MRNPAGKRLESDHSPPVRNQGVSKRLGKAVSKPLLPPARAGGVQGLSKALGDRSRSGAAKGEIVAKDDVVLVVFHRLKPALFHLVQKGAATDQAFDIANLSLHDAAFAGLGRGKDLLQ